MSRKAKVYVNKEFAGLLEETEKGVLYRFWYIEGYQGEPVSLTMPVEKVSFEFKGFPPFFDGVLPEGYELEALLKRAKIDAEDYFSQLVIVGKDLVGNVTVEPFA